MKGGLLVMLTALSVFEKTPWANNIGWEVLVLPDEELGSIGSKEFLKEAAERNHLGLLFEPSLPDGSLTRTRMGTAQLILKSKGQAAHVGRDFLKGRNAIKHLAELLLKIDHLNEDFHDAIFNIGYISGGGPTNVVPDSAEVRVGIRYGSKVCQEKLERELDKLVEAASNKPGIHLESQLTFFRPPKELSPGIEALFSEFKKVGRVLGLDLNWKDTGGSCDGNILADFGLPNIDNLGVRGNNIHSSEEYMFLDSLVERTQLTCLFLMELASGLIPLSKKAFPNQI